MRAISVPTLFFKTTVTPDLTCSPSFLIPLRSASSYTVPLIEYLTFGKAESLIPPISIPDTAVVISAALIYTFFGSDLSFGSLL
ncbi:MAG: hypothetical protein MRZ40_03185 [Ligilactobacillus animalis]|nr:hypothetical protein [Ligilactobacillus animalis]MCI5941556.1 hypothetical protein [Ligilactobacillus animalis]